MSADDDPTESGPNRRAAIMVAAAGLLLTAAVTAGRLASPRTRVLGVASRPASAHPWPVFDPDAELPAREFAVRGFAERGALRIESSEQLHDAVLVLVSNDAGNPRLIEQRPDFAAAGMCEFYGLTAGQRHGFVRIGQRASELFDVVIAHGEIAVAHVAGSADERSRSLELRRDGRVLTEAATVLLDYGDFDVLHAWSGTPIVLHTPLLAPDKVTVALSRGADGAFGLGLERRIEPGEGVTAIDIEGGSSSLALASAPTLNGSPYVPGADDFAFSITPGTDSPEFADALAVSHLLACVRESEFAIPPRIHTWSHAAEAGAVPPIRGLDAGRFRIAAGLQRQARYTLWRLRDVAAGEALVARIQPLRQRPPALDAAGAALLPAWIRSFPSAETTQAVLASTRERLLHPFGLSEVWVQRGGPDFTLKRRVGWLDGAGELLRLPAAELPLTLPSDVAARASELRVRVGLPGIDFDWATAWEYRATTAAGCAAPLADVPDGELDATLVLDDGTNLVCHAAIDGGVFVDGPPRWIAAGTTAEFASVEANAVVKDAERGATAVEAAFVKPQSESWTRQRLGAELGFEIESLRFETLGLIGHASGEVVRVAAGDEVAFAPPRGELIEVQAQDAKRTLWGIASARWHRSVPAPSSARIAILNRTGRRTLHVTLARAELRIALEPGDVHELSISAPTEVFLLSVVRVEPDAGCAAEEGLGVELRAEDVLVVEYD